MLKALYDLAMREKLVSDPDYEWKPVAWLVRVDTNGNLLGIQGTHYLPQARTKKKPKPIPKSFLVPRQPVRTSGDQTFFLVDKAEYVLGIDPSKQRDPKRLRRRAELFREETRRCAEGTTDEGARAILTLLSAVAEGHLTIVLPEDCAPNDLFAFVLSSDEDQLISSRPRIREYWRRFRQLEEGTSGGYHCLITGNPCTPGVLHVQLKRLPGASTSGVPLVSFNQPAFESYGWSRNENAPVSRPAAEAYGTALNRLLHPAWPDPEQPGVALPRRSTTLSNDTVVCYWAADRTGDVFLDDLDALFQSDPAKVEQLYQSVWYGRPAEELDFTAFFALTLTGTQGRAIVRDWFESTIGQVQRNLAQHFRDLEIARNTPRPKDRDLQPHLPLRVILRSLAPLGDDERVPAGLAAQLVRAALARAVERTRAEMSRKDWGDLERRDARASLIKAVLNRRRRTLPEAQNRYKEVTFTMDLTNTNPGYLLGRLMATIERLQQLAQPEIRATVVDRYFAGASAAPRAVFVRLLKGARHHAKKAKDEPQTRGTAQWLERELDRIAFPFNPKQNGFPAHLSVEDQGLFVLGYHHQRHVLWMSKEQRASWLASLGLEGQEAEDTKVASES
jgi:CRISPR-associated protein Csd1